MPDEKIYILSTCTDLSQEDTQCLQLGGHILFLGIGRGHLRVACVETSLHNSYENEHRSGVYFSFMQISQIHLDKKGFCTKITVLKQNYVVAY